MKNYNLFSEVKGHFLDKDYIELDDNWNLLESQKEAKISLCQKNIN